MKTARWVAAVACGMGVGLALAAPQGAPGDMAPDPSLLAGKGPVAGPLPPDWKPGQRWIVSVELDVFNPSAAPGAMAPGTSMGLAKPSTPILWHFQVARVEDDPHQPVRRTTIQARRSGTKTPQAELVFVSPLEKGKPKAMALERLRVEEGPGVIERDFLTMAPDPSPAMVTGTPLPLSFPYFSPRLMGKTGASASARYEITEQVGDMAFAMDVIQKVVTGPEAAGLARELGIDTTGKRIWLFELRRPTDGMFSRQVWVEGEPWARRVFANSIQSTLIGKGVGG